MAKKNTHRERNTPSAKTKKNDRKFNSLLIVWLALESKNSMCFFLLLLLVKCFECSLMHLTRTLNRNTKPRCSWMHAFDLKAILLYMRARSLYLFYNKSSVLLDALMIFVMLFWYPFLALSFSLFPSLIPWVLSFAFQIYYILVSFFSSEWKKSFVWWSFFFILSRHTV